MELVGAATTIMAAKARPQLKTQDSNALQGRSDQPPYGGQETSPRNLHRKEWHRELAETTATTPRAGRAQSQLKTPMIGRAGALNFS